MNEHSGNRVDRSYVQLQRSATRWQPYSNVTENVASETSGNPKLESSVYKKEISISARHFTVNTQIKKIYKGLLMVYQLLVTF